MGKKSKRRTKIKAPEPAPAPELSTQEKITPHRPRYFSSLVRATLKANCPDEVPPLNTQLEAVATCTSLEEGLFNTSIFCRGYNAVHDLVLALPPVLSEGEFALAPFAEKDRRYEAISAVCSTWQTQTIGQRDLNAAAHALRYAMNLPPQVLGEFRAIVIQLWLRTIQAHRYRLSENLLKKHEDIKLFIDSNAAMQLKQISKDETECTIIRVTALLIRAEIASDPTCREATYSTKEAAYRRRMLHLLRNPSNELRGIPEEVVFKIGDKQMKHRILEKFSSDVQASSNRLAELEGPPLPTILELYEDKEKNKRIHNGFAHQLGGRACDFCKKERSVELPVLLTCKSCRLVHYCSEKCQKCAWHCGHRDQCRAIGVFKPNDDAYLYGLEEMKNLNGEPVLVKQYLGCGLYQCQLVASEDSSNNGLPGPWYMNCHRRHLGHVRPEA